LRATLVVLAPILVGLGEPTQQHSAASADAQASEIYVIQTDGSGRRDISSSPSPDSGPVACRPRRQAHAQSRFSGPRFSPARQVLVFEDRLTNNLKPRTISSISARGRGFRVLTRCPVSAPARRPVWSHDARRIAFEQRGYVWVMSSRGRGKRRLVWGSAPVWSPVSDDLAFLDGEKLTVVRLRSGRRRTILNRAQYFAWSPDARRFAVVRGMPRKLDQLYVVGVHGRGLRRLTAESAEIFGQPAWSRDGSKLFYTVGT
jgi:dipeptidyl aminopeptidase/acylaminoacyl peptidase